MDPLIIIVLAIIVGIMVMAIMQPMFSMYDQLSGALGYNKKRTAMILAYLGQPVLKNKQ